MLTHRQREVLALYACGRSRREIAAVVFLSESTIRDCLTATMDALETQNLRQTVAKAFALGVLVADHDGVVRVNTVSF